MIMRRFSAPRHSLTWVMLFVVLGVWLAALPLPARAQSAPEGRGSDPAWQASYWTNPTLAGDPILTRDEANIAYNWGSGSPAPQVPADRFSARWSRYIYFDRESVYRFALASDDGARLFIDGQMVIDAWYDHTYKTFIADKRLAAGHHLVQVEYYDNVGAARVDFSWQDTAAPPPPTPAPPTATPVSDGWRGEYFNNRDLLGAAVLVRTDPAIDFNWGRGSPQPGRVNSDIFSVRWTQAVNLAPGSYQFRIGVDDGARVYVNNRRIIDQWRVQGFSSFTAEPIYLAGPTTIKVEYFEDQGDAAVQFSYVRLGDQPTATPTAPPPPPVDPGWRGEYFNNVDLAGGAVLVRTDPAIDFDWGGGSPAPGVVNADDFSVRWTRAPYFTPGVYRFTARVDDGVRLWVNNRLVIDQWRQGPATDFAVEVSLPGGAVPLRMEYVEFRDRAVAQLSWVLVSAPTPAPPPVPDGGKWETVRPPSKWRGEYFNNPDLAGWPAFVRDDSSIDFNWGSGSPGGGIGPDFFSVRWANAFRLDGGKYRFTVDVDDGVRLWVDDRLVIDEWREQALRKFTQELELGAGNHTFRLEYVEYTGVARIRLKIERFTPPAAAIGNLVTCVPPQPQNYAWIKLYRLDLNGRWVSMGRGIGSINPTGYLKIDGLPVDISRFGAEGEPYKIEQWIDSRVVQSTGDFYRGEPMFRLRPAVDNFTPWQCAR